MKKLYWCQRHWISICLTILLVLSFALILKQGNELRMADAPQIVGTYQFSSLNPAEGEYLVFDQNGRYHHYYQFEMLEQGTYAVGEANVYNLFSDTGNPSAIVCVVDRVYSLSKKDNALHPFEKISDIPSFINVTVDD